MTWDEKYGNRNLIITHGELIRRAQQFSDELSDAAEDEGYKYRTFGVLAHFICAVFDEKDKERIMT